MTLSSLQVPIFLHMEENFSDDFIPIIGVTSHLKTSRAKVVHASFQSLLTLLLGTCIGMGTEIHRKTYLPGYPTRDLNGDANFSWSHFCQDKTFIRQLHNNFNPREVSNLLEFDKEMLKRTILEHEAIFQKQLYEFHRIYRIQKELMHELKLKQLNRLPGPSETCKLSIYTSQLNPAFDGKIWHLPHPSLVSTCWSSANVVDDKKATSKLKKSAKSLDLHLPAEAFIEKEDTEKTEREDVAHPCFMIAEASNMVHGKETNNDVKLSLGSLQITGSGRGTLKLNLHPRNDLSVHRLADLNEPVEDSIDNGAVSSCTHKLGLSEEHQQPWTPMESKMSSLHMNLLNDDSSSLDIKVEMGQEKQQFYSSSGQTKMVVNSFDSGLFTDKYPISSELLKLKFDNTEECHIPYRKFTNTLVQDKSAQSSGNYGINSKNPGFKASQMASLLSDASHLSNAAAISSSASSRGKLTKNRDHIPVSVQAFASSNTSSISFEFSQSNTDAGDKLRRNGYQHPHMRRAYKSSTHANGLCHGTQKKSTPLTRIHLLQRNPGESYLSNSNGTSRYGNPCHHEPQQHSNCFGFIDIRPVENLSLNKAFLCGIQDSITNQKKLAKNHDESSEGLVWLKERSICNASGNTEECETQLDLRFDKDKSQLIFTEFQGEEVTDQDICSLRRSGLAFDAKETRIQRHMMSDSIASEVVFGLADNSCRKTNFSNSVSYNGQSLHDHAKVSEKERQFRNCSPNFRNDINLNSEPMITNSLLECKREIPSISLVRDVGKPTCRIDLEIPADELEEDNATSQIEFVNFNHPTATVKISEEKTSSQYICTRLAAEAIVSMSVDSHNRLPKVSSFPSLPFPCDYLHLLAEVAACNAESCEALLLDDRFDAFELMTLELEELRAEEYCCNPCQHERANNEKSMASLLSRPCRAQTRRREKRDFQKDVLPGLASLSRHEVAEDLQVLGGMTTIGKAHQTSKPSARSRTRRRPTSLSVTSADFCDNSAQIHPIHTELEDAGKNIMTWGRTTRRCPRQRTPTGNTYTQQ